MGVDLWDENIWRKEFNENNVLVMTAQIFLDLLHHGYIRLAQINLLIFDECHHAKKNHPYKQIMQCFGDCKEDDYPKVMGLTASVVNEKVKSQNDLKSKIKKLECTLRSTCETSQDEEVEKFAAKPREKVKRFLNATIDDNTSTLIKKNQAVLSLEMEIAHKYAKSALRNCHEVLLELGPWAANKVAEYLIKDLGMVCVKNWYYETNKILVV